MHRYTIISSINGETDRTEVADTYAEAKANLADFLAEQFGEDHDLVFDAKDLLFSDQPFDLTWGAKRFALIVNA
nr:hypothetical protein [uncultured Sphingomonas sp.]